MSDLRGAAKGPVKEWKTERMVAPSGSKRRARQEVTLMYCEAGWYSGSGSADQPTGDALCHTMPGVKIAGDGQRWWPDGGQPDQDGWRAFHAERPVVWRIEIYQKRPWSRYRTYYCDDELPDEYRGLV